MKIKTLLCTLITTIGAVSTSYALEQSNSFLQLNQAPDSLAIVPAPPAYNSVDFLRDKAAYDQAKSLVGTERWKVAAEDADLSDANIGKPFSQAFGIEISPQNTPVTYEILKKLRTDAGNYATKAAKEHYMRLRPFMFFNSHTCTPNDEASLSKNGSYPSGHTTIGWSSALVLAEIRPERQNEILQRGYEFGQSRVICGVHWQSDVDAGRITGSAIVARLHADKAFTKMLEEAKQEIQRKTK
ncbi:acid phosphatase [Acinetobacter rathckeae]|uniref:acid phosphatase n=1 Tax=Acinetobacter rathckeae TaxID=2605272 RepID=UPI0018A2DDCD|nr:phosphatase PAP2 family protein [Acinetobacter rathckeae]MBF7686700.1 phosphatase PAP2 family protein [Acinetobacter rathckeae]MBF7695767.1 phosphatase PAP2 family protein [Acinetobacter rathckeae]